MIVEFSLTPNSTSSYVEFTLTFPIWIPPISGVRLREPKHKNLVPWRRPRSGAEPQVISRRHYRMQCLSCVQGSSDNGINVTHIQFPVIGSAFARRKASLSRGPWNKPQQPLHASVTSTTFIQLQGFMPRKPLDRRRME